MKKYVYIKIGLCAVQSLFFAPINLYSVTVGSDSVPSRQALVTFSGSGNTVLGFAALDAGFVETDSSTTLTFNAFFPVNQLAAFNRGTLYLLQDLVLDSSVTVSGVGTIYGNGNLISFGERNNRYVIPSVATQTNTFVYDNVDIYYGASVLWQSPITFQGACVVDGGGHFVDFGEEINIRVASGGSVLFKNITIRGLSGTNFACTDNTGTMSFSNAELIMTGNFNFNNGHFDIITDSEVHGSYTFSYRTTQTSFIRANAELLFEMEATFSYAPSNNANYLISMENNLSQLHLNGNTLYLGPGGLQITKGTLVLEGNCPVVANGDLILGDGTAANNMYLNVLPDSGFTCMAGRVVYKNV